MEISLKKIGPYLAGGFAAQAAAAIAGMLLVRWMSVGEYAIYTVGVTIVGGISLLTRGGVQMGLAAALAKVWPDREGAAEAVSAAFKIRMLVSCITMPPILALSWFLFERADAEAGIRFIILGVLAVYWLADTRSSVIDQVLFFDGRAIKVQALDTAIAAFRVILVVVLQLMNRVSATYAMITNLFAAIARVPFIQHWVRQSLGRIKVAAPEPTTRAIRSIALRQMPVDIFTVLQAQVAIFYLTRHGGGIELATFGALARIAQLLTPFASLSLAFFVPAFASIHERVGATVLKYAAFSAIPGLVLVAWAWLAPATILFFFGPAYRDQSGALLVFAIAVTFTSTVQVAWSLVSHRGWNRWGWLRIMLGLVWIAIAPLLVRVETAAGSYIFNCGFSAVNVMALVLELLTSQAAGEIRLGRSAARED